MRRVVLVEFRTERCVPLTVTERDAVRLLHPGLRVEPSMGTDGRYDITPDQRIGVVCLPDLVLEVRPKVPMASVLWMVSYACDAARWRDQRPDFTEDDGLTDLIAIVLARFVEHATRRGLLNGYQTEDEAMQAPRGRILFDEHLRRRLGAAPPIEVRHDVYTADVLENRILLAAIETVRRVPLRSSNARSELNRARRLLGAVTHVCYPPSRVPDVLFTQLNKHYQAAIGLATLVLQSASLDLGGGRARGSAFLIDMNLVFERFVRQAIREAIGVDRAQLPDRTPTFRLDVAGAVPLKPDLCLLKGGRVVWVGDAKYKRLPAGAYVNADIYQLLAYAVGLNLPSGTLIYAADEGTRSAQHVIVHCGKRLKVVALDLAASPAVIIRQITAVAAEAALASKAECDPPMTHRRLVSTGRIPTRME